MKNSCTVMNTTRQNLDGRTLTLFAELSAPRIWEHTGTYVRALSWQVMGRTEAPEICTFLVKLLKQGPNRPPLSN